MLETPDFVSDEPVSCFHDMPEGNGQSGERPAAGNRSAMGGGGGGGEATAETTPAPQTQPAAPSPASRPDYASMNAYQLRRAAASAGMKGGARANRESALSYLNSLGSLF